LLEYGRANEWVVTEKLGDSVNNNIKNKSADAAKKTNVKVQKKSTRSKFMERLVIYLFFLIF
jgi:beta-mannan synthase